MEGTVENVIDAPEGDFGFVESAARIAVYDDLLSSPRIIDIQPASTREFIDGLAAAVYDSARQAGGTIPYSIILQVAENFIHARFREMVVSVLDGGNTIRFSDQGPGIADKEKAQQPGYSSATSPMKRYIHGVGSGLPIVREYMETKHGTVRIEDNMDSGAVVTISLNAPAAESEGPDSAGNPGHGPQAGQPHAMQQPAGQAFATQAQPGQAFAGEPAPQAFATQIQEAVPQAGAAHRAGDPLEVAMGMLSQRALQIVRLFVYEDVWGVKDVSQETGIPISSTYAELKKLEEAGMMARLGKKYRLTELGERVAQNLS